MKYSDTIKLKGRGNVRMVAHRGLSGMETENTAAAFIAAANRSYYGIETDIRKTLDGVYICNHDGRSGRICDKDLVMEETTFEELRALRLNDVDGKPDRAELMLAVPQEYRKICEHYKKVCVTELKSNFTLDEVKTIIQMFEGYLDQTVFISFAIENLDLVKEVLPEHECQFLCWEFNDDLPGMLAERKMGVDIYYKSLTKEAVDAFHAAGVKVNCWVVDDPDDASRMLSYGVDCITTDILE